MPAIVCEVCGEVSARPVTTSAEFEYKGWKHRAQLSGHHCDVCGSEYANAEDLRSNKRLRMAFEKQVDGLLTGAEVRVIRNKLKLTQEEAAAVFGGGRVAFSKYESDDVAQALSMDRLLRLLDRLPGVLGVLKDIAGIPRSTTPAHHYEIAFRSIKGVHDVSEETRATAAAIAEQTESLRSKWAYVGNLVSRGRARQFEWNDQPDPSEAWAMRHADMHGYIVTALEGEMETSQVFHAKDALPRSFTKSWGEVEVVDTFRGKL